MLTKTQLISLINDEEAAFSNLLATCPLKTKGLLSWDANPDDVKDIVDNVVSSMEESKKQKALVTLLTTVPCSYNIIKDMLGDIRKDIPILLMFIDLQTNPSIIEDFKDVIQYDALCSNTSYITSEKDSELSKLKTYYSLLAENKKTSLSAMQIHESTLAQLEA